MASSPKITKPDFKLPKATSYSSITSSITKAFVDSIVLARKPTNEEYDEYMKIFPLTKEGKKECAYCGGPFKYYEHFRPLVEGKLPSGYGSDIYNLVPSCGGCNEGKHGDNWKTYMEKRTLVDDPESHKLRYQRLEAYEEWGEGKVVKVDFREVIGDKDWDRYLFDKERIHALLRECYELQKQIKEKVKAHYYTN